MFTIKDEEGHNQIWKPTPGNTARAHWRIQKILESLPPKAKILELGCGYGDLTEALLKAGHQVTAIDKSPKMILATRKRCAFSEGLVLHTCDIANYLSETDHIFDAIVGMGILHHLYWNLPETLKKISEHSGPQGRALFWEPNRQNPLVKFIFGTTWGRQFFKLEKTEEAFSIHHFDLIAKPLFKRIVLSEKDWAYPFLPKKVGSILRSIENYTPRLLNKYIGQSIWIELHQSDALVAKMEMPK